MQYVLTIRNHTHYFGIHNLYNALERPDGVGLLSVSNHVTTIDSASLPTPPRWCSGSHVGPTHVLEAPVGFLTPLTLSGTVWSDCLLHSRAPGLPWRIVLVQLLSLV